MTDRPSAVVRGKAKQLHGRRTAPADRGQSDAFVSAGNTGAQMAASMVLLRLHAGSTPAIATLLPTSRNPIVVLDSGANVDCSAEELVQFARLGATYAQCMLGRDESVGRTAQHRRRAEKGNAVTKETHTAAAARTQLHRQRRGTRPAAGGIDTATSTSSSATASSATCCSSSTKPSRR
jgi:glycerol-3-phosphate acyltransferase PlsX